MMKKIFTLFSVGLLLSPLNFSYADEESVEELLAELAAIHSYLERTYGKAEDSLTESELRLSIKAGAQWLMNAQEKNGHFRYEYLPYEGTYRNDDNIVRQAGVLYALGEVLRRSSGNTAELEETMERSIGYFESISKESKKGSVDFRCIPRVPSTSRCPLGAASLALIGILSYVEHAPEKEGRYAPLIRDYLVYILSAQKEGGGFRNNHIIGRSSQSDIESAFSNGEALLALVRYYAYRPDEDVRRAIDEAFVHLEAEPFDANLYLWMMAALRDMHELWPNDAYITYAKDFTDWRLAQAGLINTRNRNYCPYAEGLASALTLLRKRLNENERSALERELDLRNRKHLTFQLTADDRYRLLPERGELVLKVLKAPALALGGFLTEDAEPTERIDFTQHCITAYVETLVDLRGGEL